MRKHFHVASAYLIVAAVAVCTIAGCKKESGSAGQGGQGGQGGAATTQKVDSLSILIWSEYLPESVATRFTDKTGIELKIVEHNGNEEVLKQLQRGVADYDLVVVSDYTVTTLAKGKLIQTIDRAKLKNFGNLDPAFLDQQYDPKNAHSIPYLWGITALAWDKQKIAKPVESWDVLFDPANKGRIVMLDDMRECFAVQLRRMGKSLNETDPAVLEQAAAALVAQNALVRAYDSGSFAEKLAAGDVWLAHGYNGQLAKTVAEDPERFAFVMPKEGGTVAMDNLCIPAKSAKADAVHLLIDFILEPENAAEIVNLVNYPSPNEAAKKFIDPNILNNPAVYPPMDVLKRCEFIRNVGEATAVYDRLWSKVKVR